MQIIEREKDVVDRDEALATCFTSWHHDVGRPRPTDRVCLHPRELQPVGRRRTLDVCEAAGPVQATPRVAKTICGSKLLGDRRMGDAHTTKHRRTLQPSAMMARTGCGRDHHGVGVATSAAGGHTRVLPTTGGLAQRRPELATIARLLLVGLAGARSLI